MTHIWEAELGGSWFQASPGQKKKSQRDPISKNKPGMAVHAYNPNYSGGTGRKIKSLRPAPGKNTIFKIIKAKRSGGMAQLYGKNPVLPKEKKGV
jgi:hypothetical protein